MVVLGGQSETGKTFFACTAPEPIILFDIDDGTEALWEQYDDITGETYKGNFDDKDIRVIEIPIEADLADTNLEDVDDIDIIEFATNLINALNIYEIEFAKIEQVARAGGLEGGTFVVDTVTWIWMGSMDRMKYKILELDPSTKNYVEQRWDWDIANKKYINLYKRMTGLRRYGVNVIILVHTKDKYEEKKIEGKKKIVKSDTDEVFHWQKKSPQMSPLILHVMKKMRMNDETGKAEEVRETKFVRIRGLPNAARLSRPIIDITWDKLLQELHEIRVRHDDGGVEADNNAETENKSARRRRRTRGEANADKNSE